MIETEVKVLEISDEIENKIEGLGGKKIFEGDIISVHFSIPGKVLRIRKIGNDVFLGYKEFLHNKHAKVANEIEVKVSDRGKMRAILEKMGYSVSRTIKKHRKSFILNTVRIDIDKYPGIPRLMEIEGTLEKIKETAELLEIPLSELKPWSLKDVERHYKSK